MDSIAAASSSSRFVSESAIKEAQERRQEEWKKAYERLGQEAPPLEAPTEKYDPRTLYEKLKEQKDAKQAAFEEKHSIRNEWQHGLEDDEAQFIASVMNEKKTAEQQRQAEIDAELAMFRQATAVIAPPLSSTATSGSPPTGAGSSSTTTSNSKALPPPKKKGLQQKGLLAGAIKRKPSGGEKESAKRKLSSSAPVKMDKPQSTAESVKSTTASETADIKDAEAASTSKSTQDATESEANGQEASVKKRKVDES